MVDVLDLEYASKGRDIDISEPVLSYLELKYNFNIVRKCCFKDWPYYLLKYKPRIVFIANGIGSLHHFNIVKTAHYLGIKVVTHFSEGDFIGTSATSVSRYFWGWNYDKILYEDLHLEWSQRNIDLISKHLSLLPQIKLSGAIGFDKYRLLKSTFLNKTDFLNKYNRTSFTKIVGIAGWCFDYYIKDYLKIDENDSLDYLTNENKNNIFESLNLVKEIIYKIVKNNPTILFVLKYHPLSMDMKYSEFEDSTDFPNIVLIHSEENIFDLINTCDMWGAFEGTTNMEAWLIENKPTFIIQPIENDFPRTHISQGSPAIRTYDDLQNYINDFFINNRSQLYESLSVIRQEIITKVIQWPDGKNHQRAAEYIYELHQTSMDKKRKYNFYLLKIYSRFIYKKFTKQIRRLLSLPIYKDERFNDVEREEWHQIYLNAVKQFDNL